MTCYFEDAFAGNDYPLTHPVIAWNNIARRATIVVSTEETGRGGVNAASPFTYDLWKPTAVAATYQMTLPAAENIAAMCIDTHDLGTVGGTVQMQETDGGAGWDDIGPAISPTDDSPIMLLFARRSTDDVRLQFTTAIPTIAVIHVSDVIELPQRVYAGVGTPIDLANTAEAENTESAKGQFLGRSIRRVIQDNDFPVQHLKEAYVRDTLAPLIEDAREYPYFLAERPIEFGAAVSYRWRRGLSIQPERMGVRDMMQVTL